MVVVGGVCMSYISYVCDEPVGQCLAPMLLDVAVYFLMNFLRAFPLNIGTKAL